MRRMSYDAMRCHQNRIPLTKLKKSFRDCFHNDIDSLCGLLCTVLSINRNIFTYGMELDFKSSVDLRLDEREYEPNKYLLDIHINRMFQFLESEANKQEPFVLYIGLQELHDPGELPHEYADIYETRDDHKAVPLRSCQYFPAETKLIDTMFEKNTLVVFASDNALVLQD